MLREKFKLNIFPSSTDFLRNIFTLVSGTFLAQLIAILLQPILRRLYTPENFGVFAIYLSVVGILTSINALRYEMAIILPKEYKDATNVLILSLLSNFIISSLFFFIIIFFKNSFISILKFPVLYSHWFYFIPLSAFLYTFYQSLNYWLIRNKKFMASSINKVVRRGSEGFMQLTIGVFKKPYGLLVGEIFGHILNITSGIFQISKYRFSLSSVNSKGIIKVLKRYIEFPKFNAVPALMETSSYAMPLILVNILFSEEITGYFDLARVVLILPSALIATALYQVLFQKITENINNRVPIFRDIYRISFVLAGLASLMILIISIWGIELFGFIFSSTWTTAGSYSQVLVFGFAVRFIVDPLKVVFYALEKVKIMAIWQVIYFCSIGSLFFMGSLKIDQFIILYMIIELTSYSLNYFLILLVSKQYDKKLNA